MISVIVPVYNVEKYLKKCLDSIVGQTYRDLEIIVIDDGSTDGCGAICDDYADSDERIKVIHKPNGGLLAAWKTGLLAAHGEYVGFIDSDDYIDKDFYATLLSSLVDNDADLAICSFIRESEQMSKPISADIAYGIYEGDSLETYKNEFFKFKDLTEVVRWNKLFKRNMLTANLKYYDERITLGEDFGIALSYTLDCNKIVLTEYFGYHYTLRTSSLMNKFNTQWIDNIALLMDNIQLILSDKNRSAAFNINVETLMYVGNTVYKILLCDEGNGVKKRLLKLLRNSKYVKNAKYIGNMKYANAKMKIVLLVFKLRLYSLLTVVAAKFINKQCN